MSKLRVGISGWTFAPWRGTFYPDKLPHSKELAYASRALTTIEVNGTFYSLQRPPTFQSWAAETPDDFRFAVKAPQFITHIRRLKDCEEPLANFLASGLLCLGPKLGVILWQFPPTLPLKDDRFERFLEILPHDAKQAAALAKRHGPKVKGRAFTTVTENFPVRHAFELRHPSFDTPEFRKLLQRHDVAFVTAHAGSGPYVEEPTASFAYVRLHGEGPKFAKGYPPSEIDAWKRRVARWGADGRDVYVYFSNDAKEHSPTGARKLLEGLGIAPPLPTFEKAKTAPKARRPRRASAPKKKVSAARARKKARG